MRWTNVLAAMTAAHLWVICISPASAVPPPVRVLGTPYANAVCKIISHEARQREIPETFFARLIWKESRFDPNAVSPKGAQGIAQFMPATALERGLAEPFKPAMALPASAQLLFELSATFGNLGLAAAAYNAGKERVRAWLDGASHLPAETLDYVLSITGRSADDWVRSDARHAIPPIGKGHFMSDCISLASRSTEPVDSAEPVARKEPSRKPWGIQLAGSHSKVAALAMFDRIRLRHAKLIGGLEPIIIRKRNPGMGPRPVVNVRIGANSRSEADSLCGKLLSAGCACVVLRN
jgi:hypothetical protein